LCSDQEEINSDDTDYEKQTTTSSNRKAKKLSSAMPVKDKFILLKDNLYKCKLCGEVSIVYDKHQNNSFIFNFFESRKNEQANHLTEICGHTWLPNIK
jgi:hypothetical protein